MSAGRLIALSGLPGSGKSTLARGLAIATGAMWLRIDSIEQAIRDAGTEVSEEGYRVGYALAVDNLRVGRDVIADCVNGWMLTRDAWSDTGRAAGAAVTEVEIVCSDPDEHRRRVATRGSDIPGHVPPDWDAVAGHDYQRWTRTPLRIDTAGRSVAHSVSANFSARCAAAGPSRDAPTAASSAKLA